MALECTENNVGQPNFLYLFQPVENNWSLNSCESMAILHIHQTPFLNEQQTKSCLEPDNRSHNCYSKRRNTAMRHSFSSSLARFVNTSAQWRKTHSHLDIVNSRTHWQNALWATCLFLFIYFSPWHILSTLFIQENKISIYTCGTLTWGGQCNWRVIHVHTEKQCTSRNLRDYRNQMWNLKTRICCFV